MGFGTRFAGAAAFVCGMLVVMFMLLLPRAGSPGSPSAAKGRCRGPGRRRRPGRPAPPRGGAPVGLAEAGSRGQDALHREAAAVHLVVQSEDGRAAAVPGQPVP